MKKFIKGTFELEKDVTDLVAFEEPIKPQLLEIIEWANKYEIGITFGTSDDNTYLCEFDVTAKTVQMCKGYVAELNAMLKDIFPKTRKIIEWRGDKLW